MTTTPRPRPASHRPKLGGMSVSLLNDLMHNTLDPGYAAAARRRDDTAADERTARSTPTNTALTALALVLIGLILGVAFRHTQQQAPESARARDALLRDVDRETATSDKLQRRAETLSGQLATERDAALAQSQAGDAAGTTLRRLELLAGMTPVTGPGITVVLGDARSRQHTDPVTGKPVVVPADENGRILDRDIQTIVNALWAAGAEAISVDGERLSTTTPIRAAGDAILVDLMPVRSPYRIEAVGEPDTLLPRFVDSVAARRFETFVGTYGIEFRSQRSDKLRLHAATESSPRYAEPATAEGGASTPSGVTRPGDTPTTTPDQPGVPTNGGGR